MTASRKEKKTTSTLHLKKAKVQRGSEYPRNQKYGIMKAEFSVLQFPIPPLPLSASPFPSPSPSATKRHLNVITDIQWAIKFNHYFGTIYKAFQRRRYLKRISSRDEQKKNEKE